MEQSHEALVQGGYGALQGQPLFRKLAAIYAEEANKTPRIKVNTLKGMKIVVLLYFNNIFTSEPEVKIILHLIMYLNIKEL